MASQFAAGAGRFARWSALRESILAPAAEDAFAPSAAGPLVALAADSRIDRECEAVPEVATTGRVAPGSKRGRVRAQGTSRTGQACGVFQDHRVTSDDELAPYLPLRTQRSSTTDRMDTTARLSSVGDLPGSRAALLRRRDPAQASSMDDSGCQRSDRGERGCLRARILSRLVPMAGRLWAADGPVIDQPPSAARATSTDRSSREGAAPGDSPRSIRLASHGPLRRDRTR